MLTASQQHIGVVVKPPETVSWRRNSRWSAAYQNCVSVLFVRNPLSTSLHLFSFFLIIVEELKNPIMLSNFRITDTYQNGVYDLFQTQQTLDSSKIHSSSLRLCSPNILALPTLSYVSCLNHVLFVCVSIGINSQYLIVLP